MESDGQRTVSSQGLARESGVTSAQVRKDLSYFGNFGKRGLGYGVPRLKKEIRLILGLNRRWRVALVGAGNMGSALFSYKEFRRQGFDFAGVFDVSADRVGQEWRDLRVRHIDDLESETTANEHYRAVAWTGRYLQVTLMSIPVGESIGLEKHGDTDQFLRLDAGRGQVRMGSEKDELTFVQDVSDGWCALVPAGTWHDVVNTGDEPMRLYAVYAPTHHAPGKMQATAADAERDEQSGEDEPPGWSVQPLRQEPDERA